MNIDELRIKRNKLLKESDWVLLPDSPFNEEEKTKWVTYRQKLRDLTIEHEIAPIPFIPSSPLDNLSSFNILNSSYDKTTLLVNLSTDFTIFENVPPHTYFEIHNTTENKIVPNPDVNKTEQFNLTLNFTSSGVYYVTFSHALYDDYTGYFKISAF